MTAPQGAKTFFCNTCRLNGVTTECYWDNRMKSTTGKMIPQESATNKNHACPFKQKASTTPSAPAQTAPAPTPAPAPQVVPPAPVPQAPRPAPAPAFDVASLVAALKPAIDTAVAGAFTVQIKQQLDRIEQAVAGLLMQTPTGATEEAIPDEPIEGDEEQTE